MSEKIRVQFSCPDCGSKSFVFSSEPHSMDNVESCAGCGRDISKNDIIEHSRQIAKNRADEIVRDIFKR
ncbi:ECs_2282 family putative zinc-binding protein [Enterobacter hormaechei]|uniref:ECs_2282 family putative zinc-binding protein n=1 Tax=Enterobacter hormaechei TaxID=158836 RepID=UPI0039C8B548